MAGATLLSIDVDRLISNLQQSIDDGAPRGSAATFLRDPEAAGSKPAAHDIGSLRDSQIALRGEAVGLGSLPPSPSTLRGRLGLALVRLVSRAMWWQAAQYKRFADAVQAATQIHTDELLNLDRRQKEANENLD